MFGSKMNAPAPLPGHVERARLVDAICDPFGQLVLVSGPAGFGKTTAMAQARDRMEHAGVATIWLTLDPTDNDVPRFMACLDEVLAHMGAAAAGLDAIHAIAHIDIPFALFLDDFETVHEPAILGLVREIATRLPRQGRLVIGSRSTPQLGLARMRVQGVLAEIDAKQLRFSLDEARMLIDKRVRPDRLRADELFRLHQKTEGWAAALWLASMALERAENPVEFVQRFSGSDREMADYLAEEVLGQQPPGMRQFLLRISLLKNIELAACAALNPHADCAALLEQLVAQDLFLTSVAADTPMWRLHSLFAEYLRAQLAREHPDDVARLHLAAAGWYESEQRPVPAIDHAIEGGDYPVAMAILGEHAESFLEAGRMRLLSRWFASLPQEQLKSHPRLEMVAIWAVLFTRGPSAAMAMLDASGARHSDDPYLRGHAMGFMPMLLAMQDRNEEALQLGLQATQWLPTGHRFADATLLNSMAHAFAVTGQPRESYSMLDAARQQHSAGSNFNRMYSEATEGLLDLLQGRLRHATANFRLAVDATHNVNLRRTHGNAWAGVLYAYVVYEANDLDYTEHLLNVYLPLASEIGQPDHLILSHAMRARIAFVRGEVDAALQTLTALEYLGAQRKLYRIIAAAKLERARLLLLQGHGQAARQELARANDPACWEMERRHRMLAQDIEYLALAELRWQIHFGDAARALTGLRAEIDTARQGERHRRLLALRLLRALALQRAGDVPASMAEMAEAMRFAGQEGYFRLVLDEGPEMGALVARYQAVHDNGQARDPLLRDYLQRLLQAFGLTADAQAAPHGKARSVESLTPKELQVLALMVEGYSNAALAEKLFVSESTARTHVRNISAKLGTHTRTQAVAMARKLGLIA